MQLDFHHTAVYVICRLAGMKSRYAEKVAYASQQVDDATYGHALKFKNGGIFHQTRTAHERLSIFKMMDVNDAFNVWIPFHFIPSGEGESVMERLITRAESRPLGLLFDKVSSAAEEEYALHWLGIFLHLYTDAYSHQDFKGFYDNYNQVRVIKDSDGMSIIDWMLSFLSSILAPLLPIGHAVAGKNPDIPYAVWSYSRGDDVYSVDNMTERYLPAVRGVFANIQKFLRAHSQYGEPADINLLERQLDQMTSLLAVEGDYQERHQNWLDEIHQNNFDFPDFDDIDSSLSYDRREWFRKAVKAEKPAGFREWLENSTYNFHTFQRKEGFISSDWALFMRAASIHRYVLLHRVLPECGVDIG